MSPWLVIPLMGLVFGVATARANELTSPLPAVRVAWSVPQATPTVVPTPEATSEATNQVEEAAPLERATFPYTVEWCANPNVCTTAHVRRGEKTIRLLYNPQVPEVVDGTWYLLADGNVIIMSYPTAWEDPYDAVEADMLACCDPRPLWVPDEIGWVNDHEVYVMWHRQPAAAPVDIGMPEGTPDLYVCTDIEGGRAPWACDLDLE